MRPFSMLRTVHYRVLAVLWTLGVVLAVTVPTGSMPEVQSVFGLDKVVHVVLFAGFGLLWLRGLCPPDADTDGSGRMTRALLLLAAGVLFAVGTEVYQSLAPIDRLGDPYDFAADLVGLLVAFGGYLVYVREREPSPA